ncbi:membrane hypothetical protein [uncultured delta proteobacterium]|uniref:Major facilitator superfamily (MFS) profile domain-containing protein n=1 Tax=uncultured delta proteobacterium TaxID=34034 RepID=A0A212KAM6_9DELT|nr:membrane hypothetical protein [uncultured delta proteobacterium]
MLARGHPDPWEKRAVLFLASQNVSLFGSSVTGLAIIWHVTLQTASGSWMTCIVLASMLPQVAISPLAGVWADRYNRKYLIMAADGGIAGATLLLALVYLAGYESLELLLGIAAVRSVGAGIQAPAVNAVVPQLVPVASLTRFNGINQSLNAAMQLLALFFSCQASTTSNALTLSGMSLLFRKRIETAASFMEQKVLRKTKVLFFFCVLLVCCCCFLPRSK